MKLNTAQLRRIIRESVRVRLSEAPLQQIDIAGEVSEFVVGALVEWLEQEGIDLIGSNAFEMMGGTLGEDQMPVPGRVEDVEHFAAQAAEKVLSSPDVKEKVTEICKMMLDSLMDYRGTPGPGGR